MNTFIFTNPFYIYAIVFSGIIAVYSLEWSDFYPELSIELILFFVLSIIISIIIGYTFNGHFKCFYNVKNYKLKIRKTLMIVLLLLLSYCIEFLYFGLVPLIEIIKGSEFVYKDFGIPIFHVFLLTFNAFFSLVIFDGYVKSKNKVALIFFILSILPCVLIYNRGDLIIRLYGCLIIWMFQYRKIDFKKIGIIIIGFLMGMYLFGLTGNYRINQNNELLDKSSSESILILGQANSNFENSFFLNEYFWGYLYLSSPLANLQNTIIQERVTSYSAQDTIELIVYEIIPDFISKRIVEKEGKEPILIINNFTVCTLYAGCYMYMGYIGMAIIFLCIIVITSVYLYAFINDSYFNVVNSLVSSMICFSGFSNMLSFSGFSIQLLLILFLKFKFFRKIISIYD